MQSVKNFFNKAIAAIVKAWRVSTTAVKNAFLKSSAWIKEKTENVKWKDVWDKCTTGLLIFLMTSPLLILGYIVLWFVLR